MNIVANDGNSCLHFAAKMGNLQLVEKFLDKGVDTNASDKNGHCPIHLAVLKNNRDLVELFLKRGANVNATNSKNENCLHLNIVNSDDSMFDLLLDNGADVYQKSDAGENVIDLVDEYSVYNNGCLNFVIPLLKKGIEVPKGVTEISLADAAREGKCDFIELLLSKGTDVNANYSMALFSAIAKQQMAAIELLISKGANVNAVNQNDCTPLDTALSINQNDDELIVKYLKDHGGVSKCDLDK